VEYYSLATCYYEDGKNQKKILFGIGELTKQQADQYRDLVHVLNGQLNINQFTDIAAIVYGDEKQYIDVLILNALWCKLGLDKAFSQDMSSGQKISTEYVARILTINRLLHPSSKIRTVEWLHQTLLPSILGIDASAYDRNKVFRELTLIHRSKENLERLFFTHSQRHKRRYDAYYFDGSTSWFEGSKCALAEADIEKTRSFFPKVIGLMLITDNAGFPVAWEIVNGHTKDTSSLEGFVNRISKEFGIKEITYCFDRGIASDKNFKLIGSCKSKFISAIRDNQIKEVFDLDQFKSTRVKITDKICGHIETKKLETQPKRKTVGIDGFVSQDNNIFFKELGIVKNRRYVVSFNYELFIKESQDREKRIEQALKEIAEKNQELLNAKRDRDYNATERELLDVLSKWRVRDYFEYSLLPLVSDKKAQSFKIECSIKRIKVDKDQLSDGILVYVTDHMEMTNRIDFDVSASDIVAHYKGKHVVENAFRELKSFIAFRPIYVWTEEHVKAHYDISIIACFINNYIRLKIESLGKSLRDFHAHIEKAGRVAQLISPSGITLFKLKKIDTETRSYVERLSLKTILSPALHKAHGVSQ
jgi:transposase